MKKENLFRLLVIAFFSINAYCVAQQVPLKIEKLNDNFFVYTTWQNIAGKSIPSNSMYVVTDAGIIMIDTPWDTTQLKPLLDTIQNRYHKNVVFCLATHFHDDRTGAFEQLEAKGIPCWSTNMTKKYCELNHNFIADNTFENDTTFHFGNIYFETYYPGKGHTPDNIVLWFPDQQLLYGGCFIKSTEATSLGNLSDADPKAWKQSLKKVTTKFKNPRYVITGHQDWHSIASPDYTMQLLRKFR